MQSFKELTHNPYKYISKRGRRKKSEFLNDNFVKEKYIPKKVVKKETISPKDLETYSPRYLGTTESVQRKNVKSPAFLVNVPRTQEIVKKKENYSKPKKVKNKQKKAKNKNLRNYLNKTQKFNKDLDKLRETSKEIMESLKRKVDFNDSNYEEMVYPGITMEKLNKTQEIMRKRANNLSLNDRDTFETIENPFRKS